jgi:uncharacterized protein (DUF1330 family)
MNHIDPGRANFAAFKAMPRDTPMHLLNLVRYKDMAAYPEGHEYTAKGLTGEQAFAEYFRTIAPFFEARGISIIWRCREGLTLTGPEGQRWDIGFVAAFPNAAAFLSLVTDPDYKTGVVVHRTAAVLDSRLVRFTPEE